MEGGHLEGAAQAALSQMTERSASDVLSAQATDGVSDVELARLMVSQSALEFEAADLDDSGSLDFDEFSKMMRSLTGADWKEERLREWFHTLDADDSGTITLDEVQRRSRTCHQTSTHLHRPLHVLSVPDSPPPAVRLVRLCACAALRLLAPAGHAPRRWPRHAEAFRGVRP